MELQGQRALITGGTAGIGLEAAKLFVREGAEVVVTGRDADRGQKALAEIGDARATFVAADLGDLASVEALAAAAGDVDVLVNNAGAFPFAPTVEQSASGFASVFDINVRGAYFLVAALVPGMLTRRSGSIVNVTTLAAFKGMPGASVYSASKAALASLTRTWAAEFASGGVRVNSVAPGPTRTDGVLLEMGEAVEDMGRMMPLGRTAKPVEIAEAILFLASPRSSYVTGSTLHADAGGIAV